jgi:outer membrane protein TolC
MAFFYIILISNFSWGAQIFSWQECIDLTIEKNAQLKSAKSTLFSFENQELASRFNFFPQLSADILANKGENIGLIRAPQGNIHETTKVTNSSAMLTATQNIFSGLADLGRVNQAKYSTQANRSRLQIIKATLSLTLKTAFQGLLFAKEFQKLTKKITDRREENLKMVQLRYKNGMENKGSVLLSVANLKEAKYNDLQARNNETKSRALLAQTLGFDKFADIDIRGEIPFEDPPKTAPDFEEMARLTPFYQETLFNEQSADAGIMVAKSEFFPKINFVATLGQQGIQFWPTDYERWSIALSFSLPFFSGGKDYYGTKSSIAVWRAAENNRIETSREVLSNLTKSYTDYVEAVVKNDMDKSYMDASFVRAEIARQKYNNGLLTFDDWVIIENTWVQYSQTYLQSKRDKILAQASWEYNLGQGVIP